MRRELLEGLLDQDNYRRLYQEHAGFHLAIDGLLNMLPSLIAGMASQALVDEGQRLEALERLRSEPLNMTWPWEAEAMRIAPEPVEEETVPIEAPRPLKRGPKAVAKKPVKKAARRR